MRDFDLPGPLGGLNPEQNEAVYYRGGPVLIVAGPGSGKTRVLTYRIAALVKEGVSPDRILAMTFTNKAAAEMRDRLGLLLPQGVPVPASVSTFHSFCVRALRANADSLDIARNFSVLDADDALRAFSSANEDLDKNDARATLSTISFAKNSLRTPIDLLEDPHPSSAAVARAWESYAQRLRELGALDFDDLLLYTRALLSTPAGDPLRARFESILIDEWQDTNLVQYEIVKLLADPNRSTRDVAVVGDPEQSIYGWRGSTPEVIEHFLADFAPCKVIELGLNYRSSARIVAVSAAVSSASTSSARARLYTENPDGDTVRVVAYADSDHEADATVADLRRRTGTRAILVRTKAQTRAFEKSLLRAGIKYNLVGAASFASRTEVKDALSYLRLLLNPAAEFDLRRAAAVPRRKLGPAALDAFLAAAKRSDLSPGLALLDEATISSLPSRSRLGLLEFSATMSALAEQVPHGPAACVKFVLDAGLRSFYAAEPERLENLDELLAAAYSHEAEMGSGTIAPSGQEMLERFVENMSLASASDTTESSQVSVITAHASKGREFDHVWVVGAEELIVPHSMSLDSPAEIDEERRLFFVAVSRARLGLTISYRRRHFVLGDWSDAEPSRFIELLEPLTSGPDPAVEFIYPQAPNARFTNHRPARPRRSWNPPTKAPVAAPATSPSPRLDPAQVSPGTSVDHAVFGPGTVLSLAGTLVSIDFSGKVRVLDLSFAPLQPR